MDSACSILSFYAVFCIPHCFRNVQNKKGKHLLRHFDIIHLWYVVSSVAQKLYNIESFKYIRQKICNALKICHNIKVSGISLFNILSDKKVLIV